MHRKLRVLYIVEAMGGGVFTYIVDLTNELAKKYDMYIAYAIRPQTPSDYKNYFDKRVHLVEMMNFDRSINLIKDVKAFFEIRRIAQQIQPDIVHLHSSKAGVLGRWAFNGNKVPLFYTPHGYSFLMSNYSWVKCAVYRMIEMVSAKRCCMTISCSKGEHQETLKLTKNAIYIENGINRKQLHSVLDSHEIVEENPFTVFTLGRICYQKNPFLFNEIAKAMPNVHFLWIGDGELREWLTAPNIEITGWTERKEALKKSFSGNVFILTSLWEGLPISLLEAMYMKKLCVVSDVIGNHDVIHDGKNGYVCKNTESFVSAIRRGQEAHVEQLIEQAFCDIQQTYNITEMARKYNNIYNIARTDRRGPKFNIHMENLQ